MVLAFFRDVVKTQHRVLADQEEWGREKMRNSDSTDDRADSRKTLALVLAGGNGTRLHGLTRSRAKPAVPFGGHHRIVDFSLSNCVNSGITNIALLTQYKAQSLIRHVQRNWQTVSRAFADSIEMWPAQQRLGERWYVGTADAVQQNKDLIEAADPDDVLIVAGDHVYTMDYTAMFAAHAQHGADVTISCVEVPVGQSREFGIVEVDDRLRIRAFIEKPDWSSAARSGRGTALASMGVYLFSTDYLLDCLETDTKNPDSKHDFGYDVLPRVIADANVYAHLFRDRQGRAGYWRDVGTIDSYWLAHRELLSPKPMFDFGNALWPIYGSQRPAAPALLTPAASVASTMLGAGCVVAGSVAGSVLSTGCGVEEGASVSDSVLLPHAQVGRNCRLDRVIVDSHCRVPDNTVIEAGLLSATERFYVSPNGVVLVTDEILEYRAPAQDRRIA
jgi:glucose-1-phosphate adenylyltransferase